MRHRTLDEMVSYFNQQVSEMDIDQSYKIQLLGMVSAIVYGVQKPQWIPCSERLPESTHECSGTDFDGELFYWKESDWVLAQRSTGEMVVAEYTIGDRGGYWETMDNHDINVLAWMPLPEPWRGEENETD